MSVTMREAARKIGEATPDEPVRVLHQGAVYDVTTVTYLTGSDPVETILEIGGDANVMRASATVADMLDNDPEGRVQIFIRESDDHAEYFELAAVSLHGGIRLITGAFVADCA